MCELVSKMFYCFEMCSILFLQAVVQDSNQTAGISGGVCSGVPAHLHIHVRSVVMGTIGGVPQKMIQAVELK